MHRYELNSHRPRRALGWPQSQLDITDGMETRVYWCLCVRAEAPARAVARSPRPRAPSCPALLQQTDAASRRAPQQHPWAFSPACRPAALRSTRPSPENQAPPHCPHTCLRPRRRRLTTPAVPRTRPPAPAPASALPASACVPPSAENRTAPARGHMLQGDSSKNKNKPHPWAPTAQLTDHLL